MKKMTNMDPAEAQRLTREGTENAYFKAPEPWKRLAWQSITDIAHGFGSFTADLFWLRLEALCIENGVDFGTVNKDAAGSVFQSAARAGLIQKTDRVKPSERAVAHRKPLPVWNSLVLRAYT